MSRPWWLYRSRGRIPSGTLGRRAPRPVTYADIALCRRLLEAFKVARNSSPASTESDRGIWAWVGDRYHRRLAEVLDQSDPRALARFLGSFFREDCVSGIAYGWPIRDTESWLGSRILARKSFDAIVSLAEALGVVPVETPEQGRAGIAFDEGVAELLAKIDQAVGLRMEAPDVGAPFGLDVDSRLITLEMPELIYAAIRLDQAIRLHLEHPSGDSVSVVEIGGGYGGMCYWFLRLCPDIVRYTIVDLPLIGVLQGYFLSKVLGPTAVSFVGESAARVTLFPSVALAEVDTPVDVVVNKDSMPEMPRDAMVAYLEWARLNCEGIFYSYNQEAASDFLGGAQGIVSATIDKLGGFRRVRRDHSWLRRGYAEEIYTCTAADVALAKLR
jgi:hypothetical protein